VVRLLRGEHKSEIFSLLFLFGVCLVLIVIMPAVGVPRLISLKEKVTVSLI
jgi:hypothetical protein